MKPSCPLFYVGLLCLLVSLAPRLAQGQNLSFSGGVQHSLFLCDDGTVYGFGKNSSGEVGIGSTSTFENLPQQVVGVGGSGILSNIRQVDAGSGNFSLAVTTCGDSLLAWGNNTDGTLGNGNNTNSSVPVRVLGIGGTGALTDVQFISGGNSMGFAILNTGRLVAWGLNDDGQLGDGTTINRNFPEYVEDCSGNPLENVRFVDGGDDFGVALLEDGTVWFWGDDERGVGGQGVVTGVDAGVTRSCAAQVMAAPGRPLTNITQITAGDGMIFALSSTDTLFAWGANWGRQLGIGTDGDQGYPTPVVDVGNTGGVLRGVIRIAGGNAHGVALLNTGEVVAWGVQRNGQLGDNDFGNCPSGTSGCRREFPDYVLNPGGTDRLSGIADISEGDDGSFAIDSTGNLFIWGENVNGQLGLGDETDRALPVRISLPCAVSAPAPPLIANLGPDVDLCRPIVATLNSGLTGVEETTFEWFFNRGLISGETDATLEIDTIGEYIFHAQRITNCGSVIEDAYDTIVVTSTSPTAVNGTYCQGGSEATLGVTGPGEYKWFDAPVGGTQLGVGNSLTVTVAGPGDVTYYVEDTSLALYSVGPAATSYAGNYRDDGLGQGDYLVFTAEAAFRLETVTVLSNDANRDDPGGWIEISVIDDATGLAIPGGVQQIFYEVTTSVDGTPYVLDVDIDVPAGGPYRLAYTGSQDRRILEVANGNFDENSFPFVVAGVMAITGNVEDGESENDRYSFFFDWEIAVASTCDRFPVIAEEIVCPCTAPPGGTPTVSPAGPLSICGTISEGLTSSTESGYFFQWYRNDGVIAAGSVDDNTYTATQDGNYYVRVVDDLANVDNPTCYAQSNTVTISQETQLTPTISITADNTTICANETVNFSIASQSNEGSSPTYDWQVNGGSVGSGTTFAPSNLMNGDVVSVVLSSSETCVTSATGTSNTIPITVNPNLTPTISVTPSANDVCPGTNVTFTATGTNLGSNPTYAWTLNTGAVGTNSDTYSNNSLADGDVVEVTVTSDETCLATMTADNSVTMIVKPLTAASGVITGSTSICDNATGEGFSIDPVANATSYTWTISGDGAIASGQTTTAVTVDFGTQTSYTVEVTPTGECGDGMPSQLMVSNTGSVVAAISLVQDPDPVCEGSDMVMRSSITGGGSSPVVEWYINGVGPQASTSPDTLFISGIANGDNVEARLTSGAACATGIPTSTGVIDINTITVPSLTGEITGADTICSGTDETYSITPSATADDYTWTLPAFVAAVGVSDEASIELAGTSLGAGNLEVVANNTCGASTPLTVPLVVHDVPEQASLTGPSVSCIDEAGLSVTANGATRATGYAWVVTDATLASGQNTSAIMVNMADVDATISVTPSNSCGAGPQSNTSILIDQPDLGAMAGSLTPDCQSSGNAYAVTDNGYTYTWSVSGDASIASGQGTAAITVDFGKQNAEIKVVAVNATGCQDSISILTDLQNCALEANFAADRVATCSGEVITFTDLSTGNVNAWDWDFGPNASPQTISGEGPHTVIFTNSGATDVLSTISLVVGNGLLTDDTSAVGVITTHPIPGAPTITGDNELCENTAGSYATTAGAGSTLTWGVPTGFTQNSGDLGPDNTVMQATAGTKSGNVTAFETSAAGCVGPVGNFAVTVNLLPEDAGAISGETALCVNAQGIWSIQPVTGADNYLWRVPTELTLVSDNGTSLTATANQIGTVNVTLLPQNACGDGASSTLQVVISDVPGGPGAVIGALDPCENTTENYSVAPVSGATTYRWTVPTGAAIVTGQGTTDVDVAWSSTGGTITVEAENQCGTGLPSQLTATVQRLPGNAGPITGSSSLCAGVTGEAYTIDAVDNATSYVWTLPSGAIETSNLGTTLTADFPTATTGLISVTPENACGQGGSTTLALEVIGNVVPTIELVLSLDTACVGDIVTVTALPTATGDNPTYSWTVGGISGSSTGISQDVVLSASGNVSVSIQMVSSLTCLSNPMADATTSITGVAPPNPVISPSSLQVCETDTITLGYVQEEGTVYTWVLPDGSTAAGDSLFLTESRESGDYVLAAENEFCAMEFSDTTNLTLDELPDVDYASSQSAELDQLTEVSGTVSIGQIAWEPKEFLDDPASTSPTFLAEDPTVASVPLTFVVTNGLCEVTGGVTVAVLLPVDIPNTFTPNEDQINDGWAIQGLESYPNAQVMVFNRWGSLVYEVFGYEEPWDGTRNGKPLPSATYYYVIKLNEDLASGEDNEFHGDVSIIR